MARLAPTDPTLSPLLLASLIGLAAFAAVRVRAAHRRGEALGGGRITALLAAIALVAIAFVSPLATLAGGYLLTAHFLQITLLMGFAPPLLLLGLPRPDPRAARRPFAGVFAVAAHPAVAIVLVNGVLFGWHDPAIYDAALAHPELYALQQVSLLAASLAFWWSIVEPDGRGRHSLSPLLKLGFILLATIPQTFAGLIFALAHRPFYAGYASAPQVLGMTHLADQQIAGACMALVSKLALFGAFSVILWRMLGSEPVDGEAPDDGSDGGGGDDDREPTPVRPPSPAWLWMLETGPTVDEPAAPARTGEPVAAGRS